MALFAVPLVFTIGLGRTWAGEESAPVVDLRCEYRVNSFVAVGLRTRGTRLRWTERNDDLDFYVRDEYELFAVDLGVTAEVDVGSRLVLVPWLGPHFAFGHASYDHHATATGGSDMPEYRSEEDLYGAPLVSIGLLAGVHLYVDERSRVTAFIDAHGSFEAPFTDDDGFTRSHERGAVTYGVSVRF